MKNKHIDEIRATAWRSQEQQHAVVLTDEELVRFRERFSVLLDEQDDEDFRFNEVKAQYRNDRKDRIDEVKRLRSLVRRGVEDRNILVHFVPDYERSVMSLYDDDGNLLATRRLKPEEHQQHIPNIYSISQTA